MDTTDIYHLDIDWKEEIEYSEEAIKLVEDLLKICPYYKSTTKTLGKHLFFKMDKKLAKQKCLLKTSPKCELYEDLEILSGNFGWCPASNEIVNVEFKIPTLKYEDLPLCPTIAPLLIAEIAGKKTKLKFKPKKKTKKEILEMEELYVLLC